LILSSSTISKSWIFIFNMPSRYTWTELVYTGENNEQKLNKTLILL
jgi:hypothetical protein